MLSKLWGSAGGHSESLRTTLMAGGLVAGLGFVLLLVGTHVGVTLLLVGGVLVLAGPSLRWLPLRRLDSLTRPLSAPSVHLRRWLARSPYSQWVLSESAVSALRRTARTSPSLGQQSSAMNLAIRGRVRNGPKAPYLHIDPQLRRSRWYEGHTQILRLSDSLAKCLRPMTRLTKPYTRPYGLSGCLLPR